MDNKILTEETKETEKEAGKEVENGVSASDEAIKAVEAMKAAASAQQVEEDAVYIEPGMAWRKTLKSLEEEIEKELGKANASIPSLKTIDVKDGKESTVPVVLKSPVKVWVRNDMDTGKLTITPTLDKKQVTDNEIQAPMDKGTKIGTATITLAEDKLGYLEDNNAPSTEIITDKTVEKANIFVIGWRRVAEFFGNLF